MTRVLGGADRYIEVMSKATVDVIMSHEVPARRLKKEQTPDSINEEAVEMTIWLKDFP